MLGAVVKLGGSVITDKRGDSPRIRRVVLRRIATELGAGGVSAIVHGAGSFGHGPVKRAGLHEGLVRDDQRLAWGEIQVLQNELDAVVCRALLRAGIPAVPCQPSAAAILRDRRLQTWFDEVPRRLVGLGLVPVLYGVPAVDLAQGVAILSGDVLAPELALRLGATRLLLGTDVDGVYAADPRRDPRAEHLPRITPRTWPEVEAALAGSSSVDVTGGMRGKVAELVAYAARGVSSRIFDLTRPGRLAAALRGEPVGTLITAD
jgi:isopentenyl phosphate kinase